MQPREPAEGEDVQRRDQGALQERVIRLARVFITGNHGGGSATRAEPGAVPPWSGIGGAWVSVRHAGGLTIGGPQPEQFPMWRYGER